MNVAPVNKKSTVMEADMVINRTLVVDTATSLIIVDTDIVLEAMATQARIPNTAEVTETIILVADTEITDMALIMVEGMDPKVTAHLHTEATEHLTEVITPQVMEDTTRMARDTEVPLMVVTEATSSEVMEATSSEATVVTEATSSEAMAVTEATSSEVMEASEATSSEVMEATSLVEAMVTMNPIQPPAKKNTSQNENLLFFNP